MGAGDVERVHQGGEIGCPKFHIIGLQGAIGLAVAALIITDELEVLGQALPYHGEILAPEQRTADQRQWLAVAHIFVKNIDPVRFDFRHSSTPNGGVKLARISARRFTPIMALETDEVDAGLRPFCYAALLVLRREHPELRRRWPGRLLRWGPRLAGAAAISMSAAWNG